jgi:hypothetical protein
MKTKNNLVCQHFEILIPYNSSFFLIQFISIQDIIFINIKLIVFFVLVVDATVVVVLLLLVIVIVLVVFLFLDIVVFVFILVLVVLRKIPCLRLNKLKTNIGLHRRSK